MFSISIRFLHTCLWIYTLSITWFVNAQSEKLQKGKSVTLTDKNWDQILEGEWMLKFYAPWCPACRAMEETWEKFAAWSALNGPAQVKVGSIDVTAQVALNGRFMITKLPTIYHVKDGEFRQYSGSREMEDFIKFIGNDEWKEVSPVSSWTSPTSYIMSGMSKLFSFSMELKSYHSYLSTEHGFPQWLSMLLFGLVIILVGLLMGVIFVLVSDYFWGGPDDFETIVHKKDDDDALVMDDVTSNGAVAENQDEVNEGTEGESKDEDAEESTSDLSGLRQRNVDHSHE